MRRRVTALVVGSVLAAVAAAAAADSSAASTTSRRRTCTTSPSSSSGRRSPLPSPDAQFAICILGQDPFGPSLDAIVHGERVEGRPLVVRRLKGWDDAELCQVLFVSDVGAGTISQQLLGGHTFRRTLTVGEAPQFLRAGGHISFFLDGRNVRFALNPANIVAHGPPNQLQADASRAASIAARGRRRESVAARPAAFAASSRRSSRRRARSRSSLASGVLLALGRRSASGPTCVTICRH